MLPIKKVVLYKHGVGYFERQSGVEGDATIDLGFRAQEMNDVLKSLTVLDTGDGLIASISYESTTPIEKQLEDIAIHLPDGNALTGLLTQIKGARVAIEAGSRVVEGTVTGIETVTRRQGEVTVTSSLVALLVGGKGMETFDLLEVKSIEFLDEPLRKDLQHLLDILISAKRKDKKRLTIFCRGKGARQVVASYIVETPVWKTSYRVILLDGKPSVIQGWALVDNTQDEDWEDVSLTLVAGLPISFIHDLYSPRYKRRPIVHVQEEEAYAPPQLEEGLEKESAYEMDEDMADMMDMAEAARGAGGMPGAPMAKKSVSRVDAMQRSANVQTRTAGVGDLFQYEITNPVTVRRNQSALVPILQGDFEGKRVAVYNPEIREKNPMSAVLFKNTTGMTLEGGPMTVLEDETYVGESMLDTLKPDEERIVPYSVELGCTIAPSRESDMTAVHRAVISNGSLYLHRYCIERREYIIKNKTDREIDLFLEHRFNHGWDLIETPDPFEKTESFYRFRFDVAAKETKKFVVSEKRSDLESFSLRGASRDHIKMWLASRYIDEKTRQELEAIAALNDEAATKERRISEREEDVQEVYRNQKRLRENLGALGESADEKRLRERYVTQLNKEEDRLERYHDEIKQLKAEKKLVEDQLREKLGKMKFEAKLV